MSHNTVIEQKGTNVFGSRALSMGRLKLRPSDVSLVHDRSSVNRLKFAWKIPRLRQVSLSDERILEDFRTFSVGRPIGYP